MRVLAVRADLDELEAEDVPLALELVHQGPEYLGEIRALAQVGVQLVSRFIEELEDLAQLP
jgi:hypothetical protein